MLMFVKLFRPKSDQTFKVKTSEPSAEINEMNSTSADKDEQEANLTTASHDSRHRSRRQSCFPQIIDASRTIKFKPPFTSIQKFHNVELDKIESDLTLQLGSRSRVELL